MEISRIQQNNNNSFKGLKDIRFLKDYNPKYLKNYYPEYSIEDAEIVDTFMQNDAFNKLFKDYDVWATFTSDKTLGKTYRSMHLDLKEVDTVIPQEESFMKKFKGFLGFKNPKKEASEEDYTAFVDIDLCKQFLSNKSLKQLISETTDEDLHREILRSKSRMAREKEDAKKAKEKAKEDASKLNELIELLRTYNVK